MRKLRIGFLVNDLQVNRYTADIIEYVVRDELFDAPVFITGYYNKPSKHRTVRLINKFAEKPSEFFKFLLIKLFTKIITVIELKPTVKKYPKYIQNIDILSICNPDVLHVSGKWSRSNKTLRFSTEELQRIKEQDLDCIIRCGSGILKGGILNITKFGVLSFHHGDNRVNRGGPTGFWEVLQAHPSSGFVIQRLNEELDGGEILVRGNIMTSEFWLQNDAQLNEKSTKFLILLLKNLANKRQLPKTEGVRIHSNSLYKIDTPAPLIQYLARVITPKIIDKAITKLCGKRTERWSVAYAEHSNHSKSLWRYKEVRNPDGCFLADPFVFGFNGEHYIFVEDFSYAEKRGRISVIRLCETGYEFQGVVLEEQFHLSFPYVFENEGNIYMVPESSENNDIRLYKCVKFPNIWKLEQIIMDDVSAADSIIISHDKSYYLLTNICSSGIQDHHSELHVFYSDRLTSNSWKPISSGNPIIFDSQKARNGGFFRHDGVLYRVNQIHGKAHYGKAFAINEILNISTEEYSERSVSVVTPDYLKAITGTHHFSANERYASFDLSRQKRRKATAQINRIERN